MLVIGGKLGGDSVTLGQAVSDLGVLAGDEVDAGEGFQRAQRDIAEIANGRRHQIKAAGLLWRG